MMSRVTIAYATPEDFEAAVEAACRMADDSGVVVLPHRATIAHDAPTRHTRITIPPARASWAARLWHDSPVNAAVVLAGYVVGALITGVGVALQAWALLGMGLALGGAALLHASACTQRPDVPMLFRIGGPAWKTLGLLLGDEQRVSRGKALEVLRRLAMGDMTEAECEAWVREVSA